MASIDNNQNEELKANQSTEHPQQTGPVAEHHESILQTTTKKLIMIFMLKITRICLWKT